MESQDGSRLLRKLQAMKQRRKFGYVLLICLLALLQSVNVVAGNTTNRTKISLGVAQGFPGATSQVPISLYSTGQVVAAQFDVTYPAGSLTPGSIVAGNLNPNFKVKWSQI